MPLNYTIPVIKLYKTVQNPNPKYIIYRDWDVVMVKS